LATGIPDGNPSNVSELNSVPDSNKADRVGHTRHGVYGTGKPLFCGVGAFTEGAERRGADSCRHRGVSGGEDAVLPGPVLQDSAPYRGRLGGSGF
jgi:hypothetical protein